MWRWKPKLIVVVGAVMMEVAGAILDPSSSSSSSSHVTRRKRSQIDELSNNMVVCLLLASSDGTDPSSCRDGDPNAPLIDPGEPFASLKEPSGFRELLTSIDTTSRTPCVCVPVWQCKDDTAGVSDVGGDGLLLQVNLRSVSSCIVPTEVCCNEVNPLAHPPTPAPAPTSCGERNTLGVIATIRGFDNRQTQFGEFPWTAAVVSSEAFGNSQKPLFVSGASLIHPQAVLTVAHHFKRYNERPEQIIVRVGEWDFEEKSEPVPHQDIGVIEIILHPDFHERRRYHDVALLVLERPVVLGATVNTICLPNDRGDYLTTGCVVSGWGKKSFGEAGRYQKVMKSISLPIVDRNQCQSALRGTDLGPRFRLHESFVCAGGEREGQDACTGDGGSPLACPLRSDPSRYVLAGVVGWGIGCGRVGLPGVYSDVATDRAWIDQSLSKLSVKVEDYVDYDVINERINA